MVRKVYLCANYSFQSAGWSPQNLDLVEDMAIHEIGSVKKQPGLLR